MQADRNAATVVDDRYGVIRADKNFDMRAEPRERLIDGVIHHLGDEVMQPARIRGANIHARTAAHSLQPFEYLNL
ncbi:hypothetical protein SDC9_93765 [bioreactor metagenome]|uniref:Uncharacterized protein n=1 Tax=bioreactor metagenome TaxID=1076179 RepID=A0A645A1V3_9ZZZZ